MMSFRGRRLREFVVPTGIVWLMMDIAEAKGRQQLYAKQAPQLLRALREMALVQSVESSNRIEGVTVAPDRLRPLVIGNARPRDRSELEIQGYRRAVNLIYTGADALQITPDLMQQLHHTFQEGAGDAGQWKQVDNDIVVFRAGAAPVVRFRTLPASDTPESVDELCLAYRHALDQEAVPSLIATASLVLDFLCIHPFRDGNGRVSRLLTLLASYHHGYEVGRYISLERLMEESGEDYYEVLRQVRRGGMKANTTCCPGLPILSAIIRRAYREFEDRAGQVKTREAQRQRWLKRRSHHFLASLL